MKLADPTPSREPLATLRPIRAGVRRLLDRCGLTAERGRFAGVEALEARVLLADDHPNFFQVFNTPNPLPVVNISFNPQSQGAASGVIETPGDNDFFRFTAPTTDFVTLWADTINEETGVSVLNSMIQVYRRNPDNTPVFVTSGRDSDLLTSGFNPDGWVGFIAQAGVEYFVRVLSETVNGPTAVGAYVLRVDAKTDPLAPNPANGTVTQGGTISVVGSDTVYKFTVPATAPFNSLFTFGDQSNPVDFDGRLDIYDANGKRVAFDSEGGYLNNAFAYFRGKPSSVYYIRMRSDAFSVTDPTSAGAFTFSVDAAAVPIPVDPVTRRGFMSGPHGIGGFNTWALFDFVAQGSGTTYITVIPFDWNGLPPPPALPDPAVHLYNDAGVQIAFNDDFVGLAAQIQITLTGGDRYYLVVEGFDDNIIGLFGVLIEANYTLNGPDDHENTPTYNPQQLPDPFTPEWNGIRRQFERATPLVWNDPRLHLDPAGQPYPDRSFMTDAFGWGRIHSATDTDLFQFTPQVDMLGSYGGDNDNAGTGLYVGGMFSHAGNINTTIRGTANNIAVWDANDWFPALRGLNGTVNAMVSFDLDPTNNTNGVDPRELYVTGQFTLAGNTANPFEDVVVNNVARFGWNPLLGRHVWSALGTGLNGTGHAITIYDAPVPPGGGPNPDPVLVVGGEFTNPGTRVAVWNGAAWSAGPAANGPVYAFATVDLPDPDDQNSPPPPGPQPPLLAEDPPLLLAIGGSFTSLGGQTANNVGLWNGTTTFLLGNPAQNGVNGVVRALTAYDPVDPVGGDPIPEYLVVGGAFTVADDQRAGTVAVSRIARFGDVAGGNELVWAPMGAGVTGPGTPTVYALHVFDGGPYAAGDPDPVVVVGGSFTGPGLNIATWNDTAWAPLGPGLGGTVRALTSLVDVGPEVGYEGSVLYAGGEFTTLGSGAPASHVAEWDVDPLTGNPVWGGGTGNGGMETGTDGPVFALVEFDDGDPNQWDRHDRPSTRLSIVVNPEPFINTFLRVYDSNYNLIYTNETIAPPFQDPSGMNDPSLFPGTGFIGIPVWGGETYYIEISGSGGTAGRYNFTLTADAYVPDDANSSMGDPVGAGGWETAPELVLNNTTGDVRNFLAPVNAAHSTRAFQTTGSGVTISNAFELGQINTPQDIDLFFFRAPSNGTAEVRLNTTFLMDHFAEFIGTQVTQLTRNGTSGTDLPLNSRLDARIRIFNNDFEEIAFSDDNGAVDGEFTTQTVGDFGWNAPNDPQRVYFRRDPLATFDVISGERYFIQIESAQLDELMALNFGEIDWRTLIGGYELLVNTMPNLNFADDHANGNVNADLRRATMFGIGQSGSGNGAGSVVGEIDNNAANPIDNDLFSFISPDNGLAEILLTPTTGLQGVLEVFNAAGVGIGQAFAGSGGQTIGVNITAQPGARYYVRVSGVGASEGSYALSVDNLAYFDDHGSHFKWYDATDIPKNLYDYDGEETVSGSIEYAGDVDIFKFETLSFDEVTVTVDGLGQFDPTVRVFEVSEDPLGNPVYPLGIGFNDDIAPGNLDAQVTFPTTAPPRTSSLSGLTLNFYYIVVSGFDPEATRGDYLLTLQMTPTDDHPDANQWDLATEVPIADLTGVGGDTGVIEMIGDTDLQRFVAPGGGGPALITIGGTSNLRFGVQVFDEDHNPITDELTGQTLLLRGDQPNSTVLFKIAEAEVVRGKVYYIQIQGGPLNPAFVNNTSATGKYTIGITTPTNDDHANKGEFPIATDVPLSIVTGDGAATGLVNVATDTDLFHLTAIADGNLRIEIDTPNSQFRPVLALFQGNQVQIGFPVIDGGPGDEDGLQNGSVVRTIIGATIGQEFYFLVSSNPGIHTTGAYGVTAFGNDPPHDPPDDYADEGEFHAAAPIPLVALTGDGSISGGLQFDGDTDLFTYLSAGDGKAYAQIVTPQGQVLDLAVRVFNQNEEEIAFNLVGIPGAEASVSFETERGQRYYILVTTAGAPGTGDYTVRVDTAPETYFMFYPEGFAHAQIREFIAVVNPNNTPVTYSIRLRYENPNLAPVVVALDEVLGAGQRGGVTVSDGTPNPLFGIVFGEPYAIVIESNLPMGASLSHYDFGTTIGENFTGRVSDFWSFARGERFPGAVEDFLVFYNPNPTPVIVTLTAYTSSGTPIVIEHPVVEGLRRGGWSFDLLTQLPLGAFAFTVDSRPVTPGAPHLGIVAALSHYDVINDGGDSSLGDPDGGSLESAVPGITSGPDNFAQISIFNPGNTAATVTMTAAYIGSALPGFSRTINVAPHTSTTLEGANLGLSSNQTAGLTFSSDVKVSVLARERQKTDANATMAYTEAGTGWFFGDAFINAERAGVQYFEDLYFYNPDSNDVTATVRILFVDGSEALVDVFIGSEGFARLKLHELPAILDRGGNQFFALEISAARPIAVTMTHYDLFLRGGWASKGAAVGLTTPLSLI